MFAKPSSARRKGNIIILLLIAAMLSGCGNSPSEGIEPSGDLEAEVLEPAIHEALSGKETPEKSKSETKEVPAAQAEVKESPGNTKIIYEGRYFDEKWYNYVDMPAEESPLVYCEIIISNVTDTSFDFVINEEVMATGEVTPVISAGTAMIEDAGTKAVYKGNNLTLTFSFPDAQDTFPQHLEISGLDKLENNVYMNNSIPGHESG